VFVVLYAGAASALGGYTQCALYHKAAMKQSVQFHIANKEMGTEFYGS